MGEELKVDTVNPSTRGGLVVAARRGFGSDNHSGAHPAALAAMAEASAGHVPAYGYDPYTARADEMFAELLGDECDVHYVFNGTGANVVALASVMRPYDAVICPSGAHINVDECGAPERIAGTKLVPVDTLDGKLTPELVKPHLAGFGFEHHSQPRVISISQVSELGTVYTPAEVRALADQAHEHGMYLHMDGARIANAVASLGVSAREAIVDAGVDVLSFGGTKNGMAFGEAVIHFGDARQDAMLFTRKQLGSWLPRCGSSRPSSRRCSTVTCGSRTRGTQTRWRRAWPRRPPSWASRSRSPWMPTRSSPCSIPM